MIRRPFLVNEANRCLPALNGITVRSSESRAEYCISLPQSDIATTQNCECLMYEMSLHISGQALSRCDVDGHTTTITKYQWSLETQRMHSVCFRQASYFNLHIWFRWMFHKKKKCNDINSFVAGERKSIFLMMARWRNTANRFVRDFIEQWKKKVGAGNCNHDWNYFALAARKWWRRSMHSALHRDLELFHCKDAA